MVDFTLLASWRGACTARASANDDRASARIRQPPVNDENDGMGLQLQRPSESRCSARHWERDLGRHDGPGLHIDWHRAAYGHPYRDPMPGFLLPHRIDGCDCQSQFDAQWRPLTVAQFSLFGLQTFILTVSNLSKPR